MGGETQDSKEPDLTDAVDWIVRRRPSWDRAEVAEVLQEAVDARIGADVTDGSLRSTTRALYRMASGVGGGSVSPRRFLAVPATQAEWWQLTREERDQKAAEELAARRRPRCPRPGHDSYPAEACAACEGDRKAAFVDIQSDAPLPAAALKILQRYDRVRSAAGPARKPAVSVVT